MKTSLKNCSIIAALSLVSLLLTGCFHETPTSFMPFEVSTDPNYKLYLRNSKIDTIYFSVNNTRLNDTVVTGLASFINSGGYVDWEEDNSGLYTVVNRTKEYVVIETSETGSGQASIDCNLFLNGELKQSRTNFHVGQNTIAFLLRHKQAKTPKRLAFIDPSGDNLSLQLDPFLPQGQPSLSPDLSTIAFINEDLAVNVVDVATQSIKRTFTADTFNSIELIPDSPNNAAITNDTTFGILDLQTGRVTPFLTDLDTNVTWTNKQLYIHSLTSKDAVFVKQSDNRQFIYRVQGDSTSFVAEFASSVGLRDFKISPNGRYTAFTMVQGMGKIFIYDSEENTLMQISEDWAWSQHPSFSAESERIVYSADRATGNFDLYTMNVDGTKRAQITFTSYDELAPDWR